MKRQETKIELTEKIALDEKLAFIDELLKYYKLIKEDSMAFKIKQFNFTHMDLELSPEDSYSNRVSLWLDFVTTVYVMFEAEPILLTETEGVPSMRHLLKGLFGFNHCCSDGCGNCFGLGYIIPDVVVG